MGKVTTSYDKDNEFNQRQGIMQLNMLSQMLRQQVKLRLIARNQSCKLRWPRIFRGVASFPVLFPGQKQNVRKNYPHLHMWITDRYMFNYRQTDTTRNEMTLQTNIKTIGPSFLIWSISETSKIMCIHQLQNFGMLER